MKGSSIMEAAAKDLAMGRQAEIQETSNAAVTANHSQIGRCSTWRGKERVVELLGSFHALAMTGMCGWLQGPDVSRLRGSPNQFILLLSHTRLAKLSKPTSSSTLARQHAGGHSPPCAGQSIPQLPLPAA